MSESNHIHLPSYPLTRTPISRMLRPLWLTIYRMTRRMRQVGWYFPIQFGDPANAAIYNRFIICCVIGIQKSFSMEAFLVTKVPYLVMLFHIRFLIVDVSLYSGVHSSSVWYSVVCIPAQVVPLLSLLFPFRLRPLRAIVEISTSHSIPVCGNCACI
jgi:hypothetical protein